MAIPLFFIASIATYPQPSRDTSARPKDGFVPDAKTAEKIAEAVLIPAKNKSVGSGRSGFRALRRDYFDGSF